MTKRKVQAEEFQIDSPTTVVDPGHYAIDLYTTTSLDVLNKKVYPFIGKMAKLFLSESDDPRVTEAQNKVLEMLDSVEASYARQLELHQTLFNTHGLSLKGLRRDKKADALEIEPRTMVATRVLEQLVMMDNLVSMANLLAKNDIYDNEYRAEKVQYLRRRLVKYINRSVSAANIIRTIKKASSHQAA